MDRKRLLQPASRFGTPQQRCQGGREGNHVNVFTAIPNERYDRLLGADTDKCSQRFRASPD